MPEKVLIYSRFPKALMLRIGERFELMDAGGKPPSEVFGSRSARRCQGDDHGGRNAAWRRDDGCDAETGRDRLLRHRL